MPRIELLYFESCPLYKDALENLRAVLAKHQIDIEVELVNVDSPEKTERLRFYGSPSIRVNGVDLEGRDNGYSYTCRIYEINDQQLGVPTRKFIEEKLNTLEVF